MEDYKVADNYTTISPEIYDTPTFIPSKTLQMLTNAYRYIIKFNKYLYMLLIPISSFFLLYISASPVAFTIEKYFNDIYYSVKDVSRIDILCIMFGVVISAYSMCMLMLNKCIYNKIDTQIRLECDSYALDTESSFFINLNCLHKDITSFIVKTILFDLFIALIIVINYIFN